MPAAIEVTDLRKSYGSVEAVRGVSFAVQPGEVFGLLGPNGAGKTTTVEILEGYRDRSGGEVRVLGHDPERRDRHLQERVGIVLQSSGFYPRVTVREAVEPLRQGIFRAARPRRHDHPRRTRREGRRSHQDLSGGQRRRLDLALALIGDPDLIFLDEPTTGFDPEARRTAWGVVQRLRDLGKTVLLTTHYLEEAQKLADRVAIVKDGRIVAEGPPDEPRAGHRALPRPYMSDGRRVEHRDRRPHRAAAPTDTRRARPRGAPRRPGGHASDARGGLPRADPGSEAV